MSESVSARRYDGLVKGRGARPLQSSLEVHAMGAIADRLLEIARVLVFAYAADEVFRLAVVLAPAAVGGLIRLAVMLNAAPGARSARGMLP